MLNQESRRHSPAQQIWKTGFSLMWAEKNCRQDREITLKQKTEENLFDFLLTNACSHAKVYPDTQTLVLEQAFVFDNFAD